MITFTDYDSLLSSIADELNRTDLDNAIPGFVRLMESQTENQTRVRQMVVTDPAFAVDSPTQALPLDYLETRSLFLNTSPIRPIQNTTIEGYVQHKSENPAVGIPSKFTVVGDNYLFSPSPDSNYTGTLIYYQRIPRLSDQVPTNWLLEKHPDIYFYGSLMNSAPFLKEDARLAVWGQLYQNAVDAMKMADDRAQTQSSGLTATARTF